MENCTFANDLPLKVVIFHGHVSFSVGNEIFMGIDVILYTGL